MDAQMPGDVETEKIKRIDLTDLALKKAFQRFSFKRPTIDNFAMIKWFKCADLIGKHLDRVHLDVSFFKVKKRGSRTITFKEFLAFLDELVEKYVDDHRMEKSEALLDLKKKLGATYPVHSLVKVSHSNLEQHQINELPQKV